MLPASHRQPKKQEMKLPIAPKSPAHADKLGGGQDQDPTQRRQTQTGISEGDLNRRKHIQPHFLESCLKIPLTKCFFKYLVTEEVKSPSSSRHSMSARITMNEPGQGWNEKS